ncbi:MAG: hypothetical protein IPO37_25700 [Saprospiraceae bacterium]|nr:hypothetical protein [Saprospiraceae bacterium]
MNTQATLQQMQKLHLTGMASAYESILKLPADAHPDTHECIGTSSMQSGNTEILPSPRCCSD